MFFRDEKQKAKWEQEGWKVDPKVAITAPFSDSSGLPRNLSRFTSPIECFNKMMSENIMEHCVLELNQRLEDEDRVNKPVSV